MDSLIGAAIIIVFISLVGSKIYQHEKEQIDPIIDKIKGWFHKDVEGENDLSTQDDFEIAFKGQM